MREDASESHVDSTIHGIAAGGDGIGRLPDGRVLFVPSALPGEHVRVAVDDVRRDYARGRLIEVIDAVPGRVAPPCPFVGAGCGGCEWQHVDPGTQAELRVAIVADALRRIARVDPLPALRPVGRGASIDFRRTTARLGVTAGRGGFRRRGSREIVPVDTCLVAHPRLAALVGGSFGGAQEVTLRIGLAGGERVALVDGRGEDVHLPADVVVATSGDRRSERAAAVHEDVGGRRYRVSIRSFFQPSPGAAELIATVVADAASAGPGDTLVDAYAGVGVIGGVVASRSGARLVAVESSASAVEDARANLADLNATVVRSEVARWRPDGDADVVVADPARPGLGRGAAALLSALGPSRLVLVSCDPASLARDAVLLRAHGYCLDDIAVIDAFPHTAHVETVARFLR